MTTAHRTATLTDQFERERRGLLAHSYRMLGSWDEAEDAVQEAYLRAFRAWPAFEERSSVRVWLYRIVTNACLTALTGRSRRALPSGLATDPAESGPWIQPIPTALVAADPATEVVAREGVRLAFVAGLQFLPARQRAVLLLREVLAFPAADVARMLDISVPAVKSALQRARARLAEVAPSPERITEPSDPRTRELLDLYMAAWENADPAAFERVLRTDAVLELLPSGVRADGNAACIAVAAPSMDTPGAWRMEPTSANGQPAALVWWHGEPAGVAVLTPAVDGIAVVSVFADPDLVARFTAAR
ncbi:RNA polymerase subunit sigma-70 [Dactylosporangium sp. NPDC049525]|uniref:RNA polymerase subunit sigma-70 n=1 Tax=Dactylosporangium sp. NPDC049525 TaxID=3154730 RepID=UPI00341E5598